MSLDLIKLNYTTFACSEFFNGIFHGFSELYHNKTIACSEFLWNFSWIIKTLILNLFSIIPQVLLLLFSSDNLRNKSWKLSEPALSGFTAHPILVCIIGYYFTTNSFYWIIFNLLFIAGYIYAYLWFKKIRRGKRFLVFNRVSSYGWVFNN